MSSLKNKVGARFSLLLMFILMQATPALATSNPAAGILPSTSSPYGKTYGEWSNRWWEWALSLPVAGHPLLDTTGADCGAGQSGQVWFLAGSFAGTVVRDCQVPQGVALFFPVINLVDVNIPPPESSVEQLRQEVTVWLNSVTTITAKIDGVPVTNLSSYIVGPDNKVFNLSMPEDNLFGVPAGTYGPAVSVGYYLMLAPLSRGNHTIEFSGATGTTFSQDVTYRLVVGN